MHRPSAGQRYQACASAFLAAYQGGVNPALAMPAEYLSRHIGCLLAARVDGKSPAEYLGDGERVLVRELATGLLTRPVTDPEQLWHRLIRQAKR